MATALIQAGGKSQRMRESLGPTHKALLPVLGLPLLERNLSLMLAAGFESIVIVTSQAEGEIADYVRQRGQQLAKSRGVPLSLYVEQQPLGTIGAAATLAAKDCPIAVIYSDNLVSLDMREFVRHHVAAGAAMTLATHLEPFQIPFGEVVTSGSRITDYREKSIHPIRISSGYYVLGPKALAAMTEGQRLDSPQLVHRLLAQGERVADFPHEELWLDMNDAASHARLEKLVAANPLRLDVLGPAADREGHLVVRTDGARLHRQVREVSLPPAGCRAVGSFDELDVADGRVVRWHVYLENVQGEASGDWLAADAPRGDLPQRTRRALSYAALAAGAPRD